MGLNMPTMMVDGLIASNQACDGDWILQYGAHEVYEKCSHDPGNLAQTSHCEQTAYSIHIPSPWQNVSSNRGLRFSYALSLSHPHLVHCPMRPKNGKPQLVKSLNLSNPPQLAFSLPSAVTSSSPRRSLSSSDSFIDPAKRAPRVFFRNTLLFMFPRTMPFT